MEPRQVPFAPARSRRPTVGAAITRRTRRGSVLRRASSSREVLALQTRSESTAKNRWAGYSAESWFQPILLVLQGVCEDRFLYLPLALYTLYVLTVASVTTGLHANGVLKVGVDVPLGLGTSMALLVAFRLNVSYNRWWEGRLLWGRAIEAARSMATALLAYPYSVDTPANRALVTETLGWSICFASFMRRRLLNDNSDALAQIRAGMETLLPDADVQLEQLGKSSHPPLFALRCMRSAHARLCEGRRRLWPGHDPKALELMLLQLSDGMHVAMTGCERLVLTPCAPGYIGVLRLAILCFLALLPFVVLELGLGVVPVCCATGFVLLGAEALAVQLEVPFGNDQNDLPLETYCLTLQADLLTLLSETDAASSRAGSTARHAAQDAADDAPPPASAPPPPPSAPQHTDQHPVFSADATLPVGLM